MIRNILSTIINLGISPQETWKGLAAEPEDSNDSFLSKFFYPLLGLSLLAIFVGVLINKGLSNMELAIKLTIYNLMLFFLGFYIASFAIKEFSARFIDGEVNLIRIQRFVGYSYSLWWLLLVIQTLFPMLFFLKFLVLYFVYIVFVGTEVYMKYTEKPKIIFFVISILSLCVSVIFLERVLGFILPGISN